MKTKIMLDKNSGMTDEDISSKYDIHIEYVRRALKAAERASMDSLSKSL